MVKVKVSKMLNSTKESAQSRSYEGDKATSKRDNIDVTKTINSEEVVACTGSYENVNAPQKRVFRQEFEFREGQCYL